jgi:hypothetical protein
MCASEGELRNGRSWRNGAVIRAECLTVDLSGGVAGAENLGARIIFAPVQAAYLYSLLIRRFVVVSTGGLVLVDESAEDGCAVDAVLGEVDGAWGSGFSL